MTGNSFFSNQRSAIILIGFGFLSLFMAGFIAPTMFLKGFVTVISVASFVTALYYVMTEYNKEYAQIK